jgi:hypothetical protein
MLSIPIVASFDGKGIKAALKGFQQLETRAQKASFILKKAGQAAALGFAAVGAAALTAGKFMLDFANMARADQLAQVQLAGTLKATTKATDAQIAAVEDYIDVTQRATGVADDDLRPSFSRLVRSTKDIAKAQKLLNLALDISGRTGKPLAAVVNGLARASEGQTSALGKLGLGYDKAELKAKSFATIQEELTKQYAGGANEKAATFEGTMARLQITFGELKESLGTYILPFLQQLADSAIKVSDAFGQGGMAKAIEELKFQLQFLLYDADGQLNAVGQQLNTLLTAYNALATTSNVGRFLPSSIITRKIAGQSAIAPEIKGVDKLATSIDISQRDMRQRGVTARQGMGAQTYAQRNPGSIIVQVSPVTDPTAVAKEIKRVLGLSERKDGGSGIRMGGK